MNTAAPAKVLMLAGVSKRFDTPGEDNAFALAGIDLAVAAGEFVVVVGPNGSGKSTLLNVIAGELKPDSGTLQFGSHADQPPPTYLARVFQAPDEGVFRDLTVLENFQLFCFGPRLSPFRIRRNGELVATVKERLAAYGLQQRLGHRVADLSQGQRQLLALELAVIRQPSLLLLDEHTASLDRHNAAHCIEATRRIAAQRGTAIIMVTHNLDEAIQFGDTLIVMRDGKITERFGGEAKQALSADRLVRYCRYLSV